MIQLLSCPMSGMLVLGGPQDNRVYFPFHGNVTNYKDHRVTWKNVPKAVLCEKKKKKSKTSGHNMSTSM